MHYKIINTHEAVNLFHQLMQPSSHIHVLRLVGAAKMGKSHLLTTVFPTLAEEYKASWALLDLHNRMHTVPDLLHMACSQFGTKGFDGYYTAHQEWTNRPKVEVRGLLAKFSRIDISARDSREDARQRDRHLTTQFTNDLAKRDDSPLLLLFDSIESATEPIQTWLLEMLLVQIARFDHIRVVLGGRSIPEVYGSYRAHCRNYRLMPVTEEAEYVAYCQSLNARLAEQSVRDFAEACDYTPGLFVDLVFPKFVQPRTFNG